MFLVAFQKIFRKIFSGVWKRRRKTQIQKNTSHNPDPVRRPRRRLRSEIAIDDVIAISPSSRDRDRRRDLAKARSRSSRDYDRRRDLAKRRRRSRSGAISRRQDRDLDPVARSGAIAISIRSRDPVRSRSDAIAIVRALCLSLSLIFRKYFEGKIEV